jgi:DNA-binding NarL/FixJ family response regulator
MNAENEPTIRVAIVEDRREIREGLSTIINGTPGFRCSGSYRTMEEALERIGSDLPDIVLNDIGLPGMSGIDGIRILKERHPSLLVLMLTIHNDDDRIFDALCAGASGYLLKNTQPARLLEALRENPEQRSRFFGVLAHTVPVTEFFSPDNMQAIFSRQKNAGVST